MVRRRKEFCAADLGIMILRFAAKMLPNGK